MIFVLQLALPQNPSYFHFFAVIRRNSTIIPEPCQSDNLQISDCTLLPLKIRLRNALEASFTYSMKYEATLDWRIFLSHLPQTRFQFAIFTTRQDAFS